MTKPLVRPSEGPRNRIAKGENVLRPPSRLVTLCQPLGHPYRVRWSFPTNLCDVPIPTSWIVTRSRFRQAFIFSPPLYKLNYKKFLTALEFYWKLHCVFLTYFRKSMTEAYSIILQWRRRHDGKIVFCKTVLCCINSTSRFHRKARYFASKLLRQPTQKP